MSSRSNYNPPIANPGVYVNGIPLNWDRNQIRSYFERFGSIKQLNLTCDHDDGHFRGSGIIEFVSTHIANACIEHMKGMRFEGCQPLIIKFANPRKTRTRSRSRSRSRSRADSHSRSRSRRLPLIVDKETNYEPKTDVYFNGLPKFWEHDRIKRYFESFGHVNSIHLVRHHKNGDFTGRGIVHFARDHMANECVRKMRGMQFDGCHPLEISIAQNQRKTHQTPPIKSETEQVSATNIVFRGTPKHWNHGRTKMYFGEFGTVTSVYLKGEHKRGSNGCGYVNFKHPTDAQKCVEVHRDDKYIETKFAFADVDVPKAKDEKKHFTPPKPATRNTVPILKNKQDTQLTDTTKECEGEERLKSEVVDMKKERISMNEWNCYAVIYWLNRLNDAKFRDWKYNKLRNMIFEHKLKGSELVRLTDIALRFAGVENKDDQKEIVHAIADLIANDNFDNMAANMSVTDTEKVYCDPILFEVMTDPVMVTLSGYTYERSNIEQYIQKYGKDPITKQEVKLEHIVTNQALKEIIKQWKQKNLTL